MTSARPLIDGLGTCPVCQRYTKLNKAGSCKRNYCRRILKRMRVDHLKRRG